MTIILDTLTAELSEALRKRAELEGRSVTDVAVEAIQRGLEVDGSGSGKKRDLSRFRGTWVEDPAFDEAIKAFRRVDEEAEH